MILTHDKVLGASRDDNGNCCLHYAVYGASVESIACLEMILLENEQYSIQAALQNVAVQIGNLAQESGYEHFSNPESHPPQVD